MDDEPRKPAQDGTSEGSNPFDTETGTERVSGEYSFVFHEVARITTVRKSVPARALRPDDAQPPTPDPDERA